MQLIKISGNTAPGMSRRLLHFSQCTQVIYTFYLIFKYIYSVLTQGGKMQETGTMETVHPADILLMKL